MPITHNPGLATQAGIRALRLLNSLVRQKYGAASSDPTQLALLMLLTMQTLQQATRNSGGLSPELYSTFRGFLQKVADRQLSLMAPHGAVSVAAIQQSLDGAFASNAYAVPAGMAVSPALAADSGALVSALLNVPPGGLNSAAQWIGSMAAAKKAGVL